jgi:hypothetical protein
MAKLVWRGDVPAVPPARGALRALLVWHEAQADGSRGRGGGVGAGLSAPLAARAAAAAADLLRNAQVRRYGQRELPAGAGATPRLEGSRQRDLEPQDSATASRRDGLARNGAESPPACTAPGQSQRLSGESCGGPRLWRHSGPGPHRKPPEMRYTATPRAWVGGE